MIAHDLVLPALAADALCLGPHWIYNQDKIARLYPNGIRRYDAPKSQYHPGKSAGDFTHYGDQTHALLRSVALRGGFDAEGWRDDWSRFWSKNTTTYRDGATTTTLDNLAHGVATPSGSNDLAGAARIAPVLAALSGASLEQRIKAAREQTALTHGDTATIDCAEFFTRVVDAVRTAAPIPQALETAAAASYAALDAAGALKAAQGRIADEPLVAAATFGLTCHTPEAFPLSLYFLLKFADQPLEALVQNAMAGGDSSARGLLIGLVMGAAHGTDWMPHAWLDELKARVELEALLQLIDLTPGHRSEKVVIPHPDGHQLDGVLDLPAGPPKAYAARFVETN